VIPEEEKKMSVHLPREYMENSFGTSAKHFSLRVSISQRCDRCDDHFLLLLGFKKKKIANVTKKKKDPLLQLVFVNFMDENTRRKKKKSFVTTIWCSLGNWIRQNG
jgi:hypothetical protein